MKLFEEYGSSQLSFFSFNSNSQTFANLPYSKALALLSVPEEIAFIRDVSTDFEEIRQLTERCTEQQLDPVHLDNLIEDFLADSEMVLN